MTTAKRLLRQRIAQELALLETPETDSFSETCPERAWLNGAQSMAERIAQILDEEGDEASVLLKRTCLSQMHLNERSN